MLTSLVLQHFSPPFLNTLSGTCKDCAVSDVNALSTLSVYGTWAYHVVGAATRQPDFAIFRRGAVDVYTSATSRLMQCR